MEEKLYSRGQDKGESGQDGGPGRTRGEPGEDQSTEQGEEQQLQYPDGGARSTRQISVRTTFATRGSWSRSEQAKEECLNSSSQRKRAHKLRVSGVFAIASRDEGIWFVWVEVSCVISVVYILEHFCSRSSVLSLFRRGEWQCLKFRCVIYPVVGQVWWMALVCCGDDRP